MSFCVPPTMHESACFLTASPKEYMWLNFGPFANIMEGMVGKWCLSLVLIYMYVIMNKVELFI